MELNRAPSTLSELEKSVDLRHSNWMQPKKYLIEDAVSDYGADPCLLGEFLELVFPQEADCFFLINEDYVTPI